MFNIVDINFKVFYKINKRKNSLQKSPSGAIRIKCSER